MVIAGNLDRMVYPSGHKRGVKMESKSERVARSRIAGRCSPFRGNNEVIPERHWNELADTTWHKARRDRYRYTSDQAGNGSCAADSGNNLKAACDTRQGLPLVVYNPLFTYHTTSGGVDCGSRIGENVEHLRDFGACPEEVWPRSKGFRAKPSQEAYRVANFFRLREIFYCETRAELVSALLQGYSVHGGYSGHAVAFCQYLQGGKLLFKNSWGNWGDNGFGVLSLRRVYLAYGVYAYKSVRIWTPDEWEPSMDQDKLAEAVRQFMISTMIRTHAWDTCSSQWRAELYQHAL